MGFGIRMQRLWRLKAGVAVCLAFALVAAVSSLAKISLLPPSLESRSLEMATASTHVVVDTPRSSALDLRQDTYSFEGLRNRAVLLGNVMASLPVREFIAKRANVPVEVLRVAPPLTPELPRARVDPSNQRRTSDILRSNDQYRLSIQADPTVPVLDIYAQTPDRRSAEALANAVVDGLREQLESLAATQRTPQTDRIRLLQLGKARGAVINHSVDWQVAALAFFLTFAASCATLIFLARVREGWRLAALSERPAGG
jgi:hypothetical protein